MAKYTQEQLQQIAIDTLVRLANTTNDEVALEAAKELRWITLENEGRDEVEAVEEPS